MNRVIAWLSNFLTGNWFGFVHLVLAVGVIYGLIWFGFDLRRKRSRAKRFLAKNRFNSYTVILLIVILLFAYGDEVLAIVLNPPPYTVLIAVALYYLTLIKDSYQKSQEAQTMKLEALQTQISSSRDSQDAKLAKLQTQLTSLQENLRQDRQDREEESQELKTELDKKLDEKLKPIQDTLAAIVEHLNNPPRGR